jgi:hypothetical protein
VAGRRASHIARSNRPSAAASVATCPASASSARDRVSTPPATSTRRNMVAMPRAPLTPLTPLTPLPETPEHHAICQMPYAPHGYRATGSPPKKRRRDPVAARLLLSIILSILVPVLSGSVLSACSSGTVSAASPPGSPSSAPPQTSRGQAVFAHYCSSCHPEAAKGAARRSWSTCPHCQVSRCGPRCVTGRTGCPDSGRRRSRTRTLPS